MSDRLKQNATLENQMRRTQRLVFQASITANATPADKKQSSDMAAAALLKTEDKDDITAVEDPSKFTTPLTSASDAGGVFAVLIDTALNPPEKLYKTTLTPSDGTITLKSMQITPEGRIALDLLSDQSLAAQDLTVLIELEYREKA